MGVYSHFRTPPGDLWPLAKSTGAWHHLLPLHEAAASSGSARDEPQPRFRNSWCWDGSVSVSSWGYPIYHPYWIGIFHEINHPAMGVPPFAETPICWYNIIDVNVGGGINIKTEYQWRINGISTERNMHMECEWKLERSHKGWPITMNHGRFMDSMRQHATAARIPIANRF